MSAICHTLHIFIYLFFSVCSQVCVHACVLVCMLKTKETISRCNWVAETGFHYFITIINDVGWPQNLSSLFWGPMSTIYWCVMLSLSLGGTSLFTLFFGVVFAFCLFFQLVYCFFFVSSFLQKYNCRRIAETSQNETHNKQIENLLYICCCLAYLKIERNIAIVLFCDRTTNHLGSNHARTHTLFVIFAKILL